MLHRLVMEVALDRHLDEGETVDHVCHNDSGCAGGNDCLHRRCINVEHLEVVDAITNWERGNLGMGGINRAVTHCPEGHAYEGENLYVTPEGSRRCRTCVRSRVQEYRARHRT